jgi:hypothetical protein
MAWAPPEAGAADTPAPAVNPRHVVVYSEPGRFAGWPANHGIWSWGDEILVGFSRGYDKDRGPFHHIDHDRPEEFLLARSRDGGLSWTVETPRPPGVLRGTQGMRHGRMPAGLDDERPEPLREPINFTHPDLAFTIRMENSNNGVSRFFSSYDRGKTWRGPFGLPLLGQPGVMGRTDYLVNGPNDCHVFLTASKDNGKEGRVFAARTTDGGLSWKLVGFIGPEPSGYAIMPATVRVGPGHLVTTIRRKDGDKSWIDAYSSRDDGSTWEFLSTPEPDTGEGNPPSLVKLGDSRLVLTYGVRRPPYGMQSRISADAGATWSPAVVLRDDGGSTDLGYPRTVVRPDGTLVTVYYYSRQGDPTRFIAASLWKPPAK